MHRLDNGQPIRTAMRDAGLSIERLAEKTKEADPAGYGISRSAIGHMVATGPSGRDPFARRSCDLVAKALDKPVEELFADPTPT
ncbi:helix-turn-helix transcriptional regulator [Streptomyces sp. NBC_01136]|uniref:helix-turn-helix domain-containing protein n=1 Tax=unclassified Streptomyces TaxID=2593676 RepID=UPI00325615E2|nr:helix-turn-helix transcriptional regulator [Streptomyces sp. NBC_01136]